MCTWCPTVLTAKTPLRVCPMRDRCIRIQMRRPPVRPSATFTLYFWFNFRETYNDVRPVLTRKMAFGSLQRISKRLNRSTLKIMRATRRKSIVASCTRPTVGFPIPEMRKHARSLIRHDSFERSRILHGLCAGKVYSALRGHYLDRPPVRGDGRLSLPDANAIWLKTWRIEVLAGKGIASVGHCLAISSITLILQQELSHKTSDTINVTRERLSICQIHSRLLSQQIIYNKKMKMMN